MAKLKQIIFRWTPAPEADIEEYKVYAAIGGGPVDYNAPNSVVLPKSKALDVDGKFFMEIPQDFPGLPLVDDTYEFGACAVDDFGHEGDLLIMASPLDFVPPAILTGGELLIV